MNSNHHKVTLSALVTRDLMGRVSKVQEHFGLSKAVTLVKLIELGLTVLGEDFSKSSESLDTGDNISHKLMRDLL